MIDQVPAPNRLAELPEGTREFLAGLRPYELETLQAIVELPADDVRAGFKLVRDAHRRPLWSLVPCLRDLILHRRRGALRIRAQGAGLSQGQALMTKITEKDEIDVLADPDLFYVRDASDPSNPDKKVPFSKIRPAGARITNDYRFSASITIPNLAAGAEADASIVVSGAAIGDHVVFNVEPPASIAVLACWCRRSIR